MSNKEITELQMFLDKLGHGRNDFAERMIECDHDFQINYQLADITMEPICVKCKLVKPSRDVT